MKITDISQEVFSCGVYPDDPAPSFDRIKRMEDGELYNLSVFSMCAHNGTHIDAPFHFFRDGKTVDQISLDAFVGICYLASCSGEIRGSDAELIIKKASACGASERILIAGKSTVSADAARAFAKSGIKLIGVEGQTVGPEDAPMEVHKILLQKQIVILEGLVLTDIAEGKYFLSAAPLDLSGFDGAPCRAYLIDVPQR